MPQDLRKRMVRSLKANAFGQGISVVIQLLSVPLFLKTWGPERYGEWLILSTIPAYLALSDLGFGGAAGNEMTMSNARGDRQRTLVIYQSTLALLCLVCAAILALFPLFSYLAPLKAWLKLGILTDGEIWWGIVLLGAAVCVTLQGGLVNMVFRSEGHYADGILYFNLVRLAEFAATAGVLIGGAGVVAVAGVIFGVRLTGMVVISSRARSFAPWSSFGFQHANMKTIREMTRPAVSLMALPLGIALGQQGFLLVIGAELGAKSVVVYSALRTIVRIVTQALSAIGYSVWPELSSAFGRDDVTAARELHRRACQASLWLAICCIAVLGVLGPWLLHVWTRNAVAMQYQCYLVLLAGMAVNALWSSSSVLQVSVNKHEKMTLLLAVSSAAGLALCAVLVRNFGLVGAAIASLATESVMAVFVLPRSLALARDNFKDFLSAMVTWPSYLWLAK